MKALEQTKGFWLSIIIVVLGFFWVPSFVSAQANMGDYDYIPPFLGVDVKPNILLLLDNSGSMNSCAYPNAATTGDADCGKIDARHNPATSPDYDAKKAYSGYFAGGSCYAYLQESTGVKSLDSGQKSPPPFNLPIMTPGIPPKGKFHSPVAKSGTPLSCTSQANPWDGNFLNWLTMRRIDIAKWSLTGGQCDVVRKDETCTTLRGQDKNTWGIEKQASLTGVGPLSFGGTPRCIVVALGNFFIGTFPGGACSEPFNDLNKDGQYNFATQGGTMQGGSTQARPAEPFTDVNGNGEFDTMGTVHSDAIKNNTNINQFFSIRVDTGVSSNTGILQKVGNRARFGLMIFNTNDGGQIAKAPSTGVQVGIGANLLTLIQTVDQINPTTNTPLAEALYEASRYFAQIRPAFIPTDYKVHVDEDPYCFGDISPTANGGGCRSNGTSGQWVDCCQSFVLIFTDGAPTQDLEIPVALRHLTHPVDPHPGDETFTDTNGNGRYDSELFTDMNGNGKYDLTDFFTDTNSNGRYDPPEPFTDVNGNGKFDSHHSVCSDYYDGPSECVGAGSNPRNSSHYLDDVAYWAHTTDLRPDGGKIALINETASTATKLSGMQNLTIYTFLAFDRHDGPNLLKDTAKFGAFNDVNADGKPDQQSEWDAKTNEDEPYIDTNENKKYDVGEPFTDLSVPPNGAYNYVGDLVPDGIPDAYFSAEDAESMRTNLLRAINDILQRSASGTSLSFSATSSTGEGAIYQSYFFPTASDKFGTMSWVGHLQALFLDGEGNFREDTGPSPDGRLVLTHDNIVMTRYNKDKKEAEVLLCTPHPSTGKRQTIPPDPKPWESSTTNLSVCTLVGGLETIQPLWEAGKLLAKRSASDRDIRTWVDGINSPDGVVAESEVISFSDTNATDLKPYLRANTVSGSKDIINFIRGAEAGTDDSTPVSMKNLRTRQRLVDGAQATWKLGDILNSNPTLVGTPPEGLDTKYQDTSYTPFFEKYRNRRHVIYVGANDGMLHAFNGGFFHPGDDEKTPDNPTTPEKNESIPSHGFFTTGTTTNVTTAPVLGKELWAFIPQELLPQLQWLADPTYDRNKHLFFVDGSPRIADARIFPDDDIHPKGWGTILIASMRMGGGLVKVDLNGNGNTTDVGEDRFRSAYFAFDITDPEKPFGKPGNQLIWVFKDNDLGFTTSFPTIVRMNKDTWYAVFGSGPLTYRGERNASLAGNRFQSPTPSEYGQVYVVNLKTGTLVKKQQVDATDRYAFMGDPAASDLQADFEDPPPPLPKPPKRDYITDSIYIGKTFSVATTTTLTWTGNMHRILTNNKISPADWTYSVLFNPQKPVLVMPTITKDKSGSPWVLFWTGRFFSSGPGSDQSDTSLQALYGIKEASTTGGCWDKLKEAWGIACASTVTNLFNATDFGDRVTSTGICDKCGKSASDTDTVADLREKEIDPRGGWFINLLDTVSTSTPATQKGQRMLSKITLFSRVATVPTYTPELSVGPCLTLGNSSLYATFYETGTAYADDNNSIGPLGIRKDTGTYTNTTNADGSAGKSLDKGTGTVLRKYEGEISGIASEVALIASSEGVTGFSQTSTGDVIKIFMKLSALGEGTKLLLEKLE